MRHGPAAACLALLLISQVARGGSTIETRVIYAPYDPTRPMAPMRAIVPVTVGSAPVPVAAPPMPMPMPMATPMPTPMPSPMAAPAPAEPAWVPPPVPVAAAPVPRASMAAEADTTSVALDNPFAGARDEYLAVANAPPPADERFVAAGPIKAPQVKPPAPKPCLTAAESQGSGVQIEGRGLTTQQIRGTVDGFAPRTTSCLPAGTRGKFTVMASFTVACSGVVSLVEVAPGSGLPPSVTSCLEYALGSAPFPAHDRQGGVSFEVPVTYGP